jgi:hypothetical protein
VDIRRDSQDLHVVLVLDSLDDSLADMIYTWVWKTV